MFSLTTIARLRSQVTLSQEEVSTLEEQAAQARASLAEWSQLLSHAEAHAAQEQPAGELVDGPPALPADPGLLRAPFEPYAPPPVEHPYTLLWPGVDRGEPAGGIQ